MWGFGLRDLNPKPYKPFRDEDVGFIKGLYWEPQIGNPKNIVGI